MITFTPLSGAARSSGSQPLAYILQVDDVRILLDCGSPDWTPERHGTTSATTSEDIDEVSAHWETYCQALKECSPTIDLVLISHGDLAHSGLYAYAYSRWGLNAPAYTTIPVQAMARITTTADIEAIRDEQDLGDAVPTQSDAEDDDDDAIEIKRPKDTKGKYVATSQEVHTAFDAINTLRYSQPTHLQGKCQGLTITPFNAGHTLGGTIWKIRSPSSGTILYAVGLNHMREHHLDGTVLYQASGGVFEPLARPDLLITDANRADVMTPRRKDRDAALIDAITATLYSRNSLFLPCDAGPRLLELLVLLDRHWSFARIRAPICLLSRTAGEMLQVVRSLMEWLGGSISKEDVGEDGGHQSRGNQNGKRKHGEEDEALGAFALRFRHLEIFPNHEAMLQRYSSKDPKLILAVPASLSHGPSRSLFAEFAAITDNVILLTGKGDEGTLAHELFEQWNNSQRPDDRWDRGKIGSNIRMDSVLNLEMHAKVPLQGDELAMHLDQERTLKEQEVANQAALARNQRVLEADEDDSDSEGSSDEEDEVTNSLMADESAMDVSITSPVEGRGRKLDKVTDAADMWANDGDEGLTKQLLSFDIYIKGNVSRATSFFKSVGNQAPRFRMFPYVEKKRRVDEYGETVDVGMWLRKGKVLEENAETEEVKAARMEQEDADKAEVAILEPPSKFVTTTVRIQSGCRLLFIDMEGLNDGRAVKTIVPQINPRKMIIVHAPPKATDVLIDSCGTIRAMTKDIYAPAAGESIQIGQQTNTFSISLSDELMKSIKMSSFEDNEVGFVTGQVYADESSIVPILFPCAPETSSKDTTKSKPNLRTLGARPSRPLPKSTMIGELKLTSLKARLAAVGVHAELIGEGTLICGAGAKKQQAVDTLEESVAVRKTGRGKVELEGNVSDVYYIVRKEIYNLHATLVAV